MKKFLMTSMLGVSMLALSQTAWSGPLKPQQIQPMGGNIILAQSADPEVQALEEQVRQLNGRIEEMSYQLLQMQEALRKAQEDNEFRFQELEKGGSKKSGALDKPVNSGNETSTASADAGAGAAASADANAGTGNGDEVSTIIDQPATDGNGQAPAGGELGAIELDANGNPVKATIAPNAQNGANGVSGTGTAALGSDADSYQVAYGHVLTGDYAEAEQEFQSYIAEFPQGKKIADAHFWLGEAYYAQGKYNEAAKTFLKAHKNYGKSPKAPEMLLKLGMSLAQLDNKDTACATLREVTRRYPQASRTVINKVASEEKRLAC